MFLCDFNLSGADGDVPRFCPESFTGIDNEVHDNLLDLSDIAADVQNCRVQFIPQMSGFWDRDFQ